MTRDRKGQGLVVTAMGNVNGARHRNGSVSGAIHRSRLLGTLSPDDLAMLLDVSRGVRRHRGDRVVNAGEDVTAVVLCGAASVRAYSDDGDLQIRALLGPGDRYGLAAALGQLGTRAEVQAETTTEALIVPGPQLRSLVETSATFARSCLRALTSELADERRESMRFAGSSTAERLNIRLLDLVERWGRPEGDQIAVAVPLTQEELASWARASRESAAKVLHTLRSAGIVETGRRELRVLDLPALQARERAAARPGRTMPQLLRSLG